MLDVVDRLQRNKPKQDESIEARTYQKACPTSLECYEDAVNKFREECFNMNKVYANEFFNTTFLEF